MPNPKGNPQNLEPGKRKGEKPLTDRMNIRMTKEMKEELSSKEDPPEFCRRAIQEALDKDRKKEE